MTETTAPVVNTAVTKAAKAAATAVSEALPTVVETAELALEVPAKVVFSQKLIVTAAVFGGVALGASVLFGLQKLKARKETRDLEKKLQDHDETIEKNTEN